MRTGESLVPMSEDQLRRIFAEGEPDWLEESSKRGVKAQDVIELLDTQAFFDLLRIPYPTDRRRVIDRLIQERLVDQDGNGYAVRRLGALLLAKRSERKMF
jgi:ATP-dependent DNA helicase RecG